MTMKIKYKYLNNGKTKLLFRIWLTQKASCSVKKCVSPLFHTILKKNVRKCMKMWEIQNSCIY